MYLVFVVHWGGGFNWFFDLLTAKAAYENECKNWLEKDDEPVALFPFMTNINPYLPNGNREKITEQIENNDNLLYEAAVIRNK